MLIYTLVIVDELLKSHFLATLQAPVIEISVKHHY